MDAARIVLGCGNFGGVGSDLSLVGQGDSQDEAFALMDAAWERGIKAFDTGSSYGGGLSERMIGSWIASRRPDGLRLTSKVFHPRHEGDDSGLAPERVRRVARDSCAHLGVERIDLFLLHAPDPETPLSQTIGALDQLVDDGLVGAIGVSNVDGAYLAEAIGLSRTGIELVQNEYSLLVRGAELDVLPLCAEHDVDFQAFSPLGGGWLTGKYRRGEALPAGSRMTLRPEPYEAWQRDDVFDAVEALDQRAAERGVPPAVLAAAWVLSQPHVTALVAGPRRVEQLDEMLSALDVSLDDRDELAALFP